MKVRIEIDTQTFVRFWLVVIGFALAGLLLYNARVALIIIGTAFFLALALSKPVAKLAKLLPGKSRVGGTALAFTLIVVLLLYLPCSTSHYRAVSEICAVGAQACRQCSRQIRRCWCIY